MCSATHPLTYSESYKIGRKCVSGPLAIYELFFVKDSNQHHEICLYATKKGLWVLNSWTEPWKAPQTKQATRLYNFISCNFRFGTGKTILIEISNDI